MQYPRTCTIAHLALAHAVEEKLQKPCRASQCAKYIISRERRRLIGIIAEGLIAEIENHAPDKISGQAPPQYHDKNDIILKQRIKTLSHCHICHRLTRLYAKVEKSTQYA